MIRRFVRAVGLRVVLRFGALGGLAVANIVAPGLQSTVVAHVDVNQGQPVIGQHLAKPWQCLFEHIAGCCMLCLERDMRLTIVNVELHA